MRLTALQLPARFDARREQLALAETLLASGPATDVALLPEASLCGYVSPRGDFDLTRFAEPLDGPTRESLAALARRFDCLVVGPLVERAGDCCFNALIAVTPGGELLLHYRKRHPWYPEEWATAGVTAAPLVTFRGVTFAAAVCFDVHFLGDEAGPLLDAADVLLFASAWVDDRDSLPGHLRSIAAAHRIDVLNANWGPGVPRLPGQGGSLFVGAGGARTERLSAAVGRLDVERMGER